MNTAVAQRLPPALIELKKQIDDREVEFARALPSHIKPSYFQRVAVTAVQNNPKLLNAERTSLLNAFMRCAQDGLIPDGRQAAMVTFRSRERGDVVQYMQMIAGIRKLVLQSGEISRFEQHVVYQNDRFEFALGDDAHILHVPVLKDRGPPIAVYSIAEFRDGSRSREVMSVEDVEKVRASSRAATDGPWVHWWSEMARKTVARRHSKVLPMSSDVADVIDRGDGWDTTPKGRPPAIAEPSSPRFALSDQFDRVAAGPDEPPPRRGPGRPPKARQPAEEQIYEAEVSETEAGDAFREPADPADVGGSSSSDPVPQGTDTGELPIDDFSWDDPDVKAGERDRNAGRTACLDPAIRKDEARFRKWRQGFYGFPGDQ